MPPPFLFVKTIEKVIRLCIVLRKKNFRVRVLKIGPFFMVFNLVLMGGGPYVPITDR